MFRIGLRTILKYKARDPDAYFSELEALTLQWAQAHPASPLAHILHANVLVAHAWDYRGGGYIKDVPPQSLRDFETYLQRAFDYLKAHADVALTDSYAHASLLSIGSGLGLDHQ